MQRLGRRGWRRLVLRTGRKGQVDLARRTCRRARRGRSRRGLGLAAMEPTLLRGRVLYTWTDAGQVAGLRRSKRLLQKTRAAGGELSRFDAGLGTGPMAELLRRPGYAPRRFAVAGGVGDGDGA